MTNNNIKHNKGLFSEEVLYYYKNVIDLEEGPIGDPLQDASIITFLSILFIFPGVYPFLMFLGFSGGMAGMLTAIGVLLTYIISAIVSFLLYLRLSRRTYYEDLEIRRKNNGIDND